MEHPKLVAASVIALAVTLFAIFSLRPIARRFGLVDKPDERKHHRGYIPLIGGLCFFLGTLAGLVYLGYLGRFVSSLMAGAGVIVVIGVIDDLNGLSVRSRVLAEAAAVCLVIAASGYYIDDLGALFGEATKLGLLGIPLTVVAVIGLINAYNMLDGIDGLAAAMTMVTIIAILLFGDARLSAPGILLLLQVLFAALIPYLFVNLGWPDGRKVFMGDAGSMLVGFLLAWSLIYLSHPSVGRLAPVDVLWCVALPVMDTIAVMYRRFRKGLSPFKPDRQHLHHLLLDAGFSPRAALLAIVSTSGFLAMFGYALRNSTDFVSTGAFVALLAAYVFWLPQLKLKPPAMARRRRSTRSTAGTPLRANGDATVSISADPAQSRQPVKALCVISAASEAVTLAPIARQISQDDRFDSKVCITAAAASETEDVLQLFDLRPDMKIELDTANDDSGHAALAVQGEMERVLDEVEPDMVLVLADAGAALATTLAAYRRNVPVVSVEPWVAHSTGADASARTTVRTLASLHMASSQARQSLIEEGVAADRILVADNTAADTLHAALEQFQHDLELNRKLANHYPFLRPDSPLLLVVETPDAVDNTEAIAHALRNVAEQRPDVDIVCLVPPGSPVAERINAGLDGLANAHAVEAPDYLAAVYLMRNADLIVGCGELRAEVIELEKPIVIVHDGSAPVTTVEPRHVNRVPGEPTAIARLMLSLLDGEPSTIAPRRHNGNGARQHVLDALAGMRPHTAPADTAQFAHQARTAAELTRERT
ncbi:UDP-N-acetylglucosamine 2-epimerase [Luteimonas suaedae]|uniref:UDP-N-acetylglucosamine 2-epimerase n=1 Tax=Luteimonas suaedae TaxID=2605430 RepID=UPI0011EF0CD8|nr:UDP-N-acetylglucosamine 2-epimerase [Luteimonas suaedae]